MAKTVSERLAEFRNNKSSYKKEKKDSSVSGRLQSHREIKSYSTINNELDELNSKFETISNGWVDSDTMDSTIKEYDDLKTKLTGYANYLKQNDDTENYNSVSELLKSWDNNRESLLNYKNLYKDFDSKKTFNKAKKEYEQFIKTQEEMRAYDTVSGSAYIDDLKSQLSSLEKQKSELDTSYKANGGWTPSSSNYNRPSQSQIDPYREWNAKSSEYAQQIKDLKNEIYQKEKFHKEAIDLKELEGFQEVIKNGDFEEKSQKGSSRDNPSPNINETITKSDGKWYIGIGPLGKKKEIKNILTFVRDNADSMGNVKVDEDFQKMLKANDDEVNLYSYLLETDEKKAQRYLDLLMPTLLDRRSDDLKERLDVPVLKHLMSVAQGMGNYLDSVGIKDYSNDASMVAMQNLQSEAEGLDKYLMGAGQTIGNMLPSIMLSHLTSGLASGLGASTKVASAIGTLTNASSVGISAKGSAYEQKIAEGWNPDDAQTYSTLIGLSEASLETILSGIVGTTGFGPEELLKKADMIDNALLRFSAKSGIRLASEEIEEIAQLYLEPTFEVIVKGGDYDQPTVDELVETAIVTAISTGTLNSPASIGEAVNDFKQTQLGKYLNKNNSVDNLKKMAIAEGINPEGRTSSNYKIGGLFNEVGQRVVERIDSANISKYKSGIASQLVERGETKSNALKIADAIVKKQSGKSLTAEEIKAISSSENGKSVLNDVKASMKGESVAWMDRLATRTTNKLNSAIATKTEFDQLAEKKSNKQNKARANAEGYKVEESATVKPQSISVDSDGKVVIDTENGLQKATEVAVDSNTAIMLGYADDMKGEEKRVFVENFDGKMDADAYYNSFELQKSYAINGASITVGRANKGRLTDSQVLNFYKYGLTQRKSEIAKKQQALDKLVEDFNKEHHEVKEGSFNATAIENVKLNRKQNAVVRIFKALASRGVNVVIENSTAEQRANNFENGWYDPETNTVHIDLNAGIIDAKKIVKDTMINTMSHELLHWAKDKSPELYEALKDMVLNAMDKSNYDSNFRINSEMDRLLEKEAYKNLSKDKLMDIAIEEIVARACEGNLAKSELMTEIINDLSARGEGLVEKFTEAIHEAVKTVKDLLGILDEYADNLSEEAQTMQEVLGQDLDAFVKAYDDLVKSALETNQALDEDATEPQKMDTKYSTRQIIDVKGKSYGIGVYLDSNLLTGLTEFERKEMVKEFVVSELAGQHFIAYDNKNNAIDIGIANKNDKIKNSNNKKSKVLNELHHKNNDVIVKQEAIVLIDELILNAKYDKSKPPKHSHNWLDNYGKNDWDYWKVFIQEKNKTVWEATLNIANTTNGEKILYDIKPIKKMEEGIKSPSTSTNNNIHQNNTKSQGKSSDRDIKRIDSEGNELSKEQQDFFANSKVRDAEGNLIPVYHGTYENFTIFDIDKTANANIFGKGHYFTSSEQDAHNNYASVEGGDVKTKIDSLAYYYFEEMGYTEEDLYDNDHIEEWNKAYDKAEEFYESGKVMKVYLNITNPVYANDTTELYDKDGNFISARSIEGLKELGFDGIIDYHASEKFDFQHLDEGTAHFVVFDSNQIKLTTNTNPTSNPDIRFSDREVQYTYNNLVSKPDMVITKLAEDISLSRAEIIREAKKNATVIGKKHNDGSISVLVDDIDTDVVISTDSIKHSLDRRIKVNGPVMLQIGKILKNSIKINELNPREDNIKKTYVLIGVAQNTNNEPYIVSFVVNSHTNKIDTVDVLYSANAKKETAVLNAPRDSTPSTVSTISISDLLKYVNKYFPDILPSDVLKHFGYSERPKGKLGESALFSDRDVPSVRSTLVDALDSITESEIDKQTLNKYRAMLDKIEKSSNELAEAKRELHDMMFTKGKYDAEKKKKLEATIKAKENTVNQWDKSLLRLESTKPFKDVVEREKKKAMQKQKVKGKEAMKDYRESVAHRTELKKLTDRAMKLNKWLNENSKDHHIPDALKTPVAELLNALDFSSKRLLKGGKETQKDVSFAERMRKVKDMLNDNSIQDGGMIFLEDGIREDFDKLVDTVGRLAEEHSQTENVLNNMTAEQLHNLNQVLRSITSSIAQANELIANNQYKNAFDCIRQTLKDAYDSPEYKSGSNTKLSKAWRGIKTFINWSNELPYYVFERFGKGGQSIFEELQDGQDKLAFLEKQILDFKKETFTDKQVADWEKEIHEFNVDGKTIKVSTAQLMGYYMLSLRKQAQGHLMGCGIAFGDMYDKEAQVYNAHITAEEMVKMFEVLTNEQIEIAKKLQNFMATVCGEWGNKISMARYGIRAFTETDYYPLKVDANELNSENAIQQEESLYRLLNMSFTKQTNPKANNRVMIYSIFDVFAQHTSDMAKYNTMALPMLDALKWFNSRTTRPNGNDEGSLNSVSVKDALDHAYGKQAQAYVLDLLKDLNSSKGSGRSQMDGFLSKLMSGSKIAMVAFNFRVALLQATSYMWASNEINPLYLLKGLIRLPSIKKAEKYSGIALWKSFGNYDINITRNMTEAIKGKSTKDKLVEITLKGAELGDKITWGYLWNACESEIKSTTNLKIGTDEFNQAVAKRLREIIYRTQVVDSILTRSPLMRSKDNATKSVTAFMSEPILRYNMVQSQIFKTIQDSKKLGIKTALSKNKGGLTRVVGVYVSSVALTTIVQSLVDALRDDDDEKEFYEKFLEAWKENGLAEITVLSKLPILSDVYSAVLSLVKYGNVYENEPMYTAWITKTIKSVMGWVNLAKDKGKATTYKNLYDTAQAISSLSGLPIGNAMREFVTLWNNTIGVMDENLKIKKYED